LKLKHAVDHLRLDLRGAVAADFGCSIGGFTDCLLQEGAVRVYAVDTGYGMLDWKLRQDERVVVMERTNAMHVSLPERVDIVTIDAAWTRQRHILPNALAQCKPSGAVLSLLKPQYEAPAHMVRRGRLLPDRFEEVIGRTLDELAAVGIVAREVIRLPQGRKRKNPEAFIYLAAGGQAAGPTPESGTAEQ
jgi:23S rRNA (cytidine1920-2'-O)/16S rRNA (cytidine1409-2'-O)-methyltransferase